MPDLSTTPGLRPVVRRVSNSGAHKDILSKFERSSASSSSSSPYSASSSGASTPRSVLSRSRPGSIKKTKSSVSVPR